MTTVILTFWTCVFATTCIPNPDHIGHQQFIGTILQCDELDADTNLPFFTQLLAVGLAPRHSCDYKSEDL